MQSLMKHLREVKMINKNGLIDKVSSIDNNLEKLERSSIKNSDQSRFNMANNIRLYHLFGIF